MARTWDNYECTFQTQNTESSDAYGNSTYYVKRTGVYRVAPVNIVRKPDQTQTASPAICYLDGKSPLYRAIMQTKSADDHKITVENVVGDTITVRVVDQPLGGRTDGVCSRIPAEGLFTFDFTNIDGVLSHIHVGHAVINLEHRAPDDGERTTAVASLQRVQAQVAQQLPPQKEHACCCIIM